MALPDHKVAITKQSKHIQKLLPRKGIRAPVKKLIIIIFRKSVSCQSPLSHNAILPQLTQLQFKLYFILIIQIILDL